MDTNRLRQFCTVVETQNLRKASGILNISHSGLSKSLKVLETDLGQELMVPDGRGIRITEFGLVVFEKAKELLAAEDLFSNSVRGQADSSEVVSIGTFEVFSTYFLGEMFQNDFQGFDLDIKELVPGHLEEAVASHTVDYGITYIPIPHPDLEFVKVCSIEMGIFGQGDKFANLPWQELAFCAPNIPVHGSPTNVKGLDGWPDSKFPRTVKYRVDMMETGLDLCRRGLGVIYIPKFIANLHNCFVYEKFKLDLIKSPFRATQRDVYIVKRKSMPEDQMMRLIAKNLRVVTKGSL